MPGERPPDRRSLRLGALVAIPVLAVALTLGSLVLPRLLFFTPMLQAQAGGGSQSGGGAGSALFQGFVYPWTAQQSGGGYSQPIALQNMRNEARTFHMNAVVIPAFADMPSRDSADLTWHAGDTGNVDTLPDAQYEQAIKDATSTGLLPILELEVRQQDSLSPNHNTSAYWVGKPWFDANSSQSYSSSAGGASSLTVGPTERAFFDEFTDYAAHFAQISAQYNLPYFIIGDQLSSISYDTSNTVKSADPAGVVGGPTGCTGRRDCEWRHLIQAIRGASYTPLAGKGTKTGGTYAGKLIYSASWNITPDGGAATRPEFEAITWWDAVDDVGVDAHFPLTHDSDLSVAELSNAWHGQGPDLNEQGDIFSRLSAVSTKFSRPLIFTSAGYESISGSNGQPGAMDLTAAQTSDYGEQRNDMAALLQTFSTAPWWLGVFWYADEPLDYGSQPNWSLSTAWANSTLAASKDGGHYLHDFYQNQPLNTSG
jgi:hypothetical protein